MFSVLILTKNEAPNLHECLNSVSWCDDTVVLDSHSTDGTQSIAKERGVRSYSREFDDFGGQRNYALDTIKFKYTWVFHLDADERFNSDLRKACEIEIQRDIHSGYFIPNRIIFLGRWIKRASLYPYPQVRLIKIGEMRFAKAGHGQREDQIKRSIGHIHTSYEPYNF